jgi:hypothetical protein
MLRTNDGDFAAASVTELGTGLKVDNPPLVAVPETLPDCALKYARELFSATELEAVWDNPDCASLRLSLEGGLARLVGGRNKGAIIANRDSLPAVPPLPGSS